jgi:hypothetical protein
VRPPEVATPGSLPSAGHSKTVWKANTPGLS